MIDIDYRDDDIKQDISDDHHDDKKVCEQETCDKAAGDQKASDQNTSDQKGSDQKPSDQEPLGQEESGQEVPDPEESDPEASDQETLDQEPSADDPSGTGSEGESADPETPENAADPADAKAKTSFFGRRKKDKEAEKLHKQLEDLTDLLKRNRAEFDNFRKRTEKEKSSMYIIGARDIVEKMLPVVDSFERGLAQAPEGDAFADGMKLIYKQLMTALEEAGVRPIEAVGKEFDPSFHNAVMHVEDENAGDNIVVEEFQKGYMYKDSVVRHSMVKVAN